MSSNRLAINPNLSLSYNEISSVTCPPQSLSQPPLCEQPPSNLMKTEVIETLTSHTDGVMTVPDGSGDQVPPLIIASSMFTLPASLTSLTNVKDDSQSGCSKLSGRPMTIQHQHLPQQTSISPSPASPDALQCSSTTISTTFNNDCIKEEDDTCRRPCLVCGDVASGYHYGVSSCEACKAFFKRTIQGNIEYTCPVNNNCEINKRRRKACQACRYQKCLRQGMLKEGVRLDRVRGGRQKYRRYSVEASGHQSAGPCSSSSVKPRVSLEDNKVLVSLAGCEPDSLLATVDTPTTTLLMPPQIVALLADLYDRELVSTIGWAKQVPGFTDLTLNDQMKLLQTTWTEVLTLSLLFRSLPRSGKLNFAADLSINETEASECGLELFYEKCMLLVDRLEYIGVCKEEFLILKAIVLANSDCPMEDQAGLEHLRESLLSSLHDAVNYIRSGHGNLHLEKLLLLLPCLRHVDTIIRMFWAKIKQEGQVSMNKLLIEMLES